MVSKLNFDARKVTKSLFLSIGIAGITSSGKTTLAKRIASKLEEQSVEVKDNFFQTK